MNQTNFDLTFLLKLISQELQRSKRVQVGLCWLIGRWLSEQIPGIEQEQADRQLQRYADILVPRFGNFFKPLKLSLMIQLFRCFPVWEQLRQQLSWSHYASLLNVDDAQIRTFYESECVKHHWTVQELRRQINSSYYERVRQDTDVIVYPSKWIKDNYVLEFAGKQLGTKKLKEHALESALINDIRSFLLELGEGFAFVGQQKRLVLESGKSLVIDMIFYHYLLHCFIIVDLKIGTLSYRDIGQMDTYVRVFDHLFRSERHMPTIGLILCSNKEESIAQYSMLHQSNRLFASTYQLQLPSSEDLFMRLEDIYYQYFGNK